MFPIKIVLLCAVISLLLFGFLAGAKTLDEELYEVDQLRAGRDTPFDEVDRRCNELLQEYTEPNDQGKIYFIRVQVEGQSGFRRPEKILEFIEKALELPQEPLKKVRLYIYRGDAIQTDNRGVHNQELIVARREAAMPYLYGLKEMLQYDLPEEKPELPIVNRVRYAGPPDTEEYLEIKRRNEEQMAAWRLAKFQRDMISYRDVLNSQISGMYSRFPWASDEIRELATKILEDKTSVERLMSAVDEAVNKRVVELGWSPQLPDANIYEPIINSDIFVPEAVTALKQGNAFVLDIAGKTLLNPNASADSEQVYNNLTKLGKGDMAWDDMIITIRDAEALTTKQNVSEPLESIEGKWSISYELPEDVQLPYAILIVTKENENYLMNIKEITVDGITIDYRKLNVDEISIYKPEITGNQ
ncbi:hypothetical protein ACFLZ8_00840 [Planctomycetota bacterium]